LHVLGGVGCFYRTFDDPNLIVFLASEILSVAIGCRDILFTTRSKQKLVIASENVFFFAAQHLLTLTGFKVLV
jgi:hypothetical protein